MSVKSEQVNPEAIKAHLKNEFHRGLPTLDCLGYHGTSLETLKYVLGRGALPGVTAQLYNSEPGDIYYYDIMAGASAYERALVGAQNFANGIAARHYFARATGLNLSDRRDTSLVREILFTEFDDIHLKRLAHLSQDQIYQIIHTAHKQQGLLLGIKSTVRERFPIYDMAQVDDEGWRVDTGGQGLPFEYIYGIQPLGEQEKLFLESL